MDVSSVASTLQRLLNSPVLWGVGDTVILLSNLLAFCAILAASWLLARESRRLVARVFAAESQEEEGATAVAEPMVCWSIMITGTLLALHALGVRVATVRDALNIELFSISGNERIVLLREFGSSSVDFELSAWMSDPWTAPRAQSALNEAIWWALKDAGVTIAFPQLDVHFDEPPADLGRRLEVAR